MGPLRSSARAVPSVRSQIRHFHPTKPARFIPETLDASTAFIQGIHSITGLPWVASIPLTAVIVRTLLGMPLQMLARINARRERDIAPLIQSWRVHFQNELKRLPPAERKDMTPNVHLAIRARTLALLEKWKVFRGYKYANLLQLPIWLSLMESLRVMTGNTNGLFPQLLSWFGGENSVENLDMIVEPTLATEGALWFPDLLAGDPTGVLPVLLSATIIMNIRRGWGITTPSTDLADLPTMQLYQATFFRGLGVFLQLMAVTVGWSAYVNELPAALLIYWITSSNLATLQTYLLEKYMFMRPPIPKLQKKFTAFKRPGMPDPFKQKLG
jgi:inner membrane protein COX18